VSEPSVSEATHNAEITKAPAASPPAVNPYKNPSYPPRVHFHERAALEESLRSSEDRIEAIRQKLDTLGNHPRRADHERIYHQMLGARDQIAEAVRRLPLETGALYNEDKERYEQAVAACERVFGRWQALNGSPSSGQ
jgi:hypothetical protein